MANVLAGMQYVQQQGELGRQQGTNRLVQGLAPDIMRGDPAAYEKAAVASPEAAQGYQEAGDRQYRRITNTTKMMRDAINSGNPQAKQAAFRTIRPFLVQLTGQEGPAEWDDSMLGGFEQLEQRVAMAGTADPSKMPSGFREFQMTAEAAGLKPGTPEYQQAANIALGREGRAATGGFGFKLVKGADGRERMGRTNPRTGMFEVYDEVSGQFTPVGGAGSLNQAPMPQPMSGAPGGFGAPLPEGGTQGFVDGSMELANQMIAAGIPEAQVDAFLRSRMNPNSGVGATQQQDLGPRLDPVRGGYLGVGPTGAEEAGAAEAARQAAQLQALPQRQAIETRGAIDRASGIAGVEAGTKRAEKAVQNATALNTYEQAMQRLENSMAATTTGPIAGRIPAVTAAQQTAEGMQATMAPILKQLFRASGEGVFTDRDQALLMDMVPSRTDLPAARAAKIEAINAIVRAKLNTPDVGQPSGPAPGAIEDGYRFRGGDPADPNNWERM